MCKLNKRKLLYGKESSLKQSTLCSRRNIIFQLLYYVTLCMHNLSDNSYDKLSSSMIFELNIYIKERRNHDKLKSLSIRFVSQLPYILIQHRVNRKVCFGLLFQVISSPIDCHNCKKNGNCAFQVKQNIMVITCVKLVCDLV